MDFEVPPIKETSRSFALRANPRGHRRVDSGALRATDRLEIRVLCWPHFQDHIHEHLMERTGAFLVPQVKEKLVEVFQALVPMLLPR